jgi:hypothetical protein
MVTVKSVFGRFSFHVALAVLFIGFIINTGRAADGPRDTESFDRAWKFYLGDAPGADQAAFDDTSWRALDIPHDWMIEGVLVRTRRRWTVLSTKHLPPEPRVDQ